MMIESSKVINHSSPRSLRYSSPRHHEATQMFIYHLLTLIIVSLDSDLHTLYFFLFFLFISYSLLIIAVKLTYPNNILYFLAGIFHQ